ncbi:MAG TPA: sigma-70 family RNA polymerase sigma factor [Polyangiaceae bacterium]|nr:sigma-70 family RNA polymerase sigma factor [Polyangiaceae bacterium]
MTPPATPPTGAPAAEDALELLGRLIRAERAELARVARREGLGAEDAIDCVQDALSTFLQLAQLGQLPPDRAALPGFVAGIVRNAARNRRRLHRLARPHDSIDALERGADEPSAEALVARAEEHVRLRACVARLCGTQRAVVTLRLLEEQRGEDVAEALGISRGHVDVLLHRAKASLRACMLHPPV